jgi:hypothetical protein
MTQPATPVPDNLICGYDGPSTVEGMEKLARLLATAGTGMPPYCRNDPGAVLALMLRARALNVSITAAADNFAFGNKGSCAMRARMAMALLTVRAGHQIATVGTATEATSTITFCDGRPPASEKFTLVTAQEAGLLKERSPWMTGYAPTMLYWRAVLKVISLHAPEVLMGYGIVESGILDDPYETGTDPAPTPIQIQPGALEAFADLADIDTDNATVTIRDEVTLDTLREAYRAFRGTDITPQSVVFLADGNPVTVGQIFHQLVEQANTRAAIPTDVADCGCRVDATTGTHEPGCQL